MQNKQWFTVLELMVGIVVFTLGFLGAYMLVDSASSASIRSRDEIIGSNIMREQIELLKNLRDTNWIQFRSWDSLELAKSSAATYTKLEDGYYTLSNDFTPGKTIHIEKLSTVLDNKNSIIAEFQKPNSTIKLCMDSLGLYVHDCTAPNKSINYASFLKIEPLITKNTSTNVLIPVEKESGKVWAYKVTVYFMSLTKWYRLTSMSTIITDWKNQ